MKNCVNCNKNIENYLNYCSWDCNIESAKKIGGKVHTPNGLPITCINANGDMFEHEHGDHQNYKFPVYVEFYGKDDLEYFTGQNHALIYSDDSIALTIFECCHAIWSLNSGELICGNLWKRGEWRLSLDSLNKIKNQ